MQNSEVEEIHKKDALLASKWCVRMYRDNHIGFGVDQQTANVLLTT
jgi:hypothetical protein